MHVAFAIFKFFPHGGSARVLAKTVARCRVRGHAVRIYALEWEGTPLAGVETVVVPTCGIRSHVRQRRFADLVAAHVATHPVDLLVGMNKMPGLDVYYAVDSCFEEKARNQRSWPYRLTPRYRHYAEFERAVFREHGRTRILMIAPEQDVAFKSVYRTPAYRFHLLPPGIERERGAATPEAGRALRRELGIAATDILLLFVGSGFVKKGLDRAIAGVAALPSTLRERVRLVVVGDDKAGRFKRLARRLRIATQVQFVGGRDDVAAFYRAADALVLPAYDEAAGMVILEAAVAGVPVLATANCGYAFFLKEADAGIVTPVPFEQRRFNADLDRLLSAKERAGWSARGQALAIDERLYARSSRVVDLLKMFAAGEPPLVCIAALEYSQSDPRYRTLVPAARACRRRGMAVRTFAGRWSGPAPEGIDVVAVPVAAVGRARRLTRQREWMAESLRSLPVRCVADFDAKSGLELRNGTEGEAGIVVDGLPPGLEPPRPQLGERRDALRADYGFAAHAVVFAMAGGDLVRHGFERLARGLGRLPEALRERCAVLAAGRLDRGFGTVGRSLNLGDRIRVDDELPALDAIAAADVFVDLPYQPSSNGWVFDAMAAGRSVIAHAAVEESALVRDARAGVVLTWPFRQDDLNRALAAVLGSAEDRQQWSVNAMRFAAAPANYGRADRVAALIEQHMRDV